MNLALKAALLTCAVLAGFILLAATLGALGVLVGIVLVVFGVVWGMTGRTA